MSYDESLLRGMPENAPDRCEWCGKKKDLKDIEDVGGLGEDDEDGGHITWTRAFMESMDKLARETGLVAVK